MHRTRSVSTASRSREDEGYTTSFGSDLLWYVVLDMGWLLMVIVTCVLGQSVQWCSPEGICIALTIPGVQGGPDGPDLYATIKAPAAHKWFAIGFGEQMKGTLMLVSWPWKDQVVVSPRLATYHSHPKPTSFFSGGC